jgi:DNA polymerase-1
MKIAMLRVAEALAGYQAHILLQVHDELLLEVSREHLPQVAVKVKQAMEDCCSLLVPLTVDCKAGENWYEMSAYDMANDGREA